MVIKVRSLKSAGLALLFLAGVLFLYLGFSGSGKEEPVKPQKDVVQVNSQESSFFVNFRQNRDNDRQRQVDLLNEIINNKNVAEDTRKAAQKQLLEFTGVMAKEGEVENLVLAKGFKDVVASINNNGLSLMVYGEEFSKEELIKLQDIAVRTTGFRMDNIVIVPRT